MLNQLWAKKEASNIITIISLNFYLFIVSQVKIAFQLFLQSKLTLVLKTHKRDTTYFQNFSNRGKVLISAINSVVNNLSLF